MVIGSVTSESTPPVGMGEVSASATLRKAKTIADDDRAREKRRFVGGAVTTEGVKRARARGVVALLRSEGEKTLLGGRVSSTIDPQKILRTHYPSLEVLRSLAELATDSADLKALATSFPIPADLLPKLLDTAGIDLREDAWERPRMRSREDLDAWLASLGKGEIRIDELTLRRAFTLGAIQPQVDYSILAASDDPERKLALFEMSIRARELGLDVYVDRQRLERHVHLLPDRNEAIAVLRRFARAFGISEQRLHFRGKALAEHPPSRLLPPSVLPASAPLGDVRRSWQFTEMVAAKDAGMFQLDDESLAAGARDILWAGLKEEPLNLWFSIGMLKLADRALEIGAVDSRLVAVCLAPFLARLPEDHHRDPELMDALACVVRRGGFDPSSLIIHRRLLSEDVEFVRASQRLDHRLLGPLAPLDPHEIRHTAPGPKLGDEDFSTHERRSEAFAARDQKLFSIADDSIRAWCGSGAEPQTWIEQFGPDPRILLFFARMLELGTDEQRERDLVTVRNFLQRGIPAAMTDARAIARLLDAVPIDPKRVFVVDEQGDRFEVPANRGKMRAFDDVAHLGIIAVRESQGEKTEEQIAELLEAKGHPTERAIEWAKTAIRIRALSPEQRAYVLRQLKPFEDHASEDLAAIPLRLELCASFDAAAIERRVRMELERNALGTARALIDRAQIAAPGSAERIARIEVLEGALTKGRLTQDELRRASTLPPLDPVASETWPFASELVAPVLAALDDYERAVSGSKNVRALQSLSQLRSCGEPNRVESATALRTLETAARRLAVFADPIAVAALIVPRARDADLSRVAPLVDEDAPSDALALALERLEQLLDTPRNVALAKTEAAWIEAAIRRAPHQVTGRALLGLAEGHHRGLFTKELMVLIRDSVGSEAVQAIANEIRSTEARAILENRPVTKKRIHGRASFGTKSEERVRAADVRRGTKPPEGELASKDDDP